MRSKMSTAFLTIAYGRRSNKKRLILHLRFQHFNINYIGPDNEVEHKLYKPNHAIKRTGKFNLLFQM